MLEDLGYVLAAILVTWLSLYMLWKIAYFNYLRKSRRFWQERAARGERSYCIHDPRTGAVYTVRRRPESDTD